MTDHVDFKHWKEAWVKISDGPSGGHGESKIVRSLAEHGSKFFLKILKDQKNYERRARLYRETSALETIDTKGVPRLIQTNARNFKNKEYQLYLVCEYI